MQSAVRESGVKTVVSFVLHWNPSLQNTKHLIERGAVGTPTYIEVDYWHGQQKWYPQYPWSVTKAQGGSSLLSAGCHALDALRWFAGNDNAIVEVSALEAPHRGDNPDWEYAPSTLVICKFADGTLGKVASILDCVMPYQFNIDIIGTKGTIRDNRVWSPELFPGQTDWATIPTVLPNSGDVTHHPFNGQIEALCAAILDDVPCLPDLDDAIKTHELLLPPTKVPQPENRSNCLSNEASHQKRKAGHPALFRLGKCRAARLSGCGVAMFAVFKFAANAVRLEGFSNEAQVRKDMACYVLRLTVTLSRTWQAT